MKKYTCIDLFAGAGGLSEGFMQAGSFEFLAHVEWEKPMINTIRNRLIKRWSYSEQEALENVVMFDIQKTEELLHGLNSSDSLQKYRLSNSELFVNNGLVGIVGEKHVDVIIGGPPCQAYSIAGRAQDPNSMKYDYRNYLFEGFAHIVQYFKPKVFVFENVPGILSASPGDKLVIKRIYEAFAEIGYEIRHPNKMNQSIYSSYDFKVPQKRNRVIIFGVKKESNINLEDFYKALDEEKTIPNNLTVRSTIENLPKLIPVKTQYKEKGKNVSHQLQKGPQVSLHYPRFHNKRDIEIFKYWLTHEMNKAPNHEKLEFYFSAVGKKTNHNKYRSLEWDEPSPTIVAHLHKDGLMFIHPDLEQLRSITVREAALLQTFPNDFDFLGSDSSKFKMIGNAVPVLFAKSIATSIKKVLERV